MATTIQISKGLQKELTNRKLSDKETYEEVIWDMVEDSKDMSEETKKEIADARAEIKAGRFYTMAEVKKELGI
jgi:predicted transcriptional regulator